ncbi:MAG TPA: phosphotransferase [Blastocatellia bacterium]|nr:phosphotransferase [Blastocatellia bacterium]
MSPENTSGIRTPYLDRIRECYPELRIASVRANHDGLVNDVVIVNDELVFRFPKNDTWARQLLVGEIRVLNLVRRYVSLPVPAFEIQIDDLVVYRFIKGNALLREDILMLDGPGQDRIAAQLAEFFRQLHSIPRDELERNAIPQSDVNRGREVWLRLYEDVQRELFPLMWEHTKEWVHRHFAPVVRDEHWMDYEPALVNGDVGSYHIIYDRERAVINGVIDFGTAGIGDPASDFVCIIYHYGESFLRRMGNHYSGIGALIDRARFWAGTLELQWALRGIRTQNAEWFTVHIGSARDVLPIGSGWPERQTASE